MDGSSLILSAADRLGGVLTLSDLPASVTHYLNAASAISPEAVHIDRPLTNMVAGYSNRDYIADRVMPPVPVMKQSDLYFTIDKNQMLQSVSPSLESPSARPPEIRLPISTASYAARTYALMGFLPQATLANQDVPLDARAQIARKLRNVLELNRELRVVAQVFSAGNYGANTSALSASQRFDDPTSDPLKLIDDAKRSVLTRVNKAVMSEEAYLALIRHPRIKEVYQGRPSFSFSGSVITPTPARANEQFLAELFELDEVLVGRAKYDSAADGAAASPAYCWTRDYFALIRVEERPNILATSTFGYTFRWDVNAMGYGPGDSLGAVGGGPSILYKTIPDLIAGGYGGEYVIGVHSDDERVIGGEPTGYLYTGVIT